MKLSIRCTITTALLLLIALASFATAQPVQAEGSRNLTDNGGDRPWLQYSGDGTTTAGILRDNLLKVYVNEGDTIYLGSSAMGIGIGDILWTARDGTTGRCSVEGAGAGRILNRAEEVAGAAPLAAGGYTPCVVSVGAGQSGIWFVTFTAPNTGNNNPNAIEADAPWTQRADITSIAAWDISVANAAGEEIKGRAYASYLPLTLARPARSLYSQLYVLTRDGYMYDWDLNGIQPTTFILFSNKKGFKIAATDAPSYQSVSLLGGEFNNLLPMEFELNAPDDPDIGTDVTNKLFFNMPSPDLPSSANRPLEATWLLRDPVQPISIENLAFAGAQSGVGGTFTFDSNSDGAFQLIIDTSGDGLLSLEQDLVLYGDAVAGPNVVEWDGLDTEGQIADISVCSEVIARGVAGEAHFPIYDAEQNPNGMIFKRVNGAEAGQFTVYYNDSQLGGEMALDGEDAENGAHVWTVLNGGDPEGCARTCDAGLPPTGR